MKSHRFFQRSRLGRGIVWFVTVQVMLLQCIPAFALPAGEQVTHGSATFVRDGNQLTINQATRQAIVNYGSFDIGVLETVQFAQPGATASILNRVVGGAGSQIAGNLLANGNVYLINPNGILFSSSANVNVGGLVASALPMSDSDFLSGRLFFSGSGGAVINEGSLAGNFIYLIGAQVENRGSISSPDVVLAAGQNSVLIDNAAGGEIRLVIDGEEEAEPIEDGEELAEAIGDEPVDEAAAEEVAADTDVETPEEATEEVADASAEVETVVPGEDTTTENLLEQLADLLLTDAGTESAAADPSGGADETLAAVTDTDALAIESLMNEPVLSDWEAGTVINQGVIDASGVEGGSITLAGVNVGQLGDVSADGEDGSGGTITIQASDTAVLGDDSVTTANAGRHGDGGEIIVFGEKTVRVASTATIEARGGSESGDGGFVETSGLESFEIGTTPDVSAANGEGGTWLIDPYNIEIVAGASTNITTTSPFQSTNVSSMLNVGLITTALALGDVTIETGAGGAELGDILFSADLDYDTTGNNLLSLIAHNDVIFNGTISDSVAGGDSLSLDVMADSDTSGAGSIIISNSIATAGGTFTVSGQDFLVASGGSVDSGAGDITVNVGDLISLGGDLTTTGDAILTSTGGGIVDAGGVVTADGLAMRAVDGIGSLGPIQTAVNTVSAQNTGSGVVRIDNDNGGGGLTVGTVDGLAGVSSTTGIIVENTSPLTIMADVVDSGGGDIRLTANGNTTADDLTLMANVTASGGNGSVLLTAGDDIQHLSGDVSAVGLGGVTYNASTGTASGVILMGGGSIQTAAGDINLTADGNIALQDVNSTGGGNITADSSTLGVTFFQDVSTGGGNLDVDAGNAISMQGIDTGGGTIDLGAGGGIDVAGVVDSRGAAVSAQAGGTILFSDTIDSGVLTVSNSVGNINFQGDVDTAGGDVFVTASAGNADFRSDLNSGGGNVNVQAGQSATFNSLGGLLTTSNGSVTVVAGNNATFTADVDTGGGLIDVRATNDVVFQQAVATGGGDFIVGAGKDAMINMLGGGLTTSTGAVSVVAGNDAMFMNAVDTGGGAFDVAAINDITVAAALTTSSGAVSATGANVDFQALLDSGGGDVTATSTVGNINFATVNTGSGGLTANSAVDLLSSGTIDTAGGAIDFDAGNNMTIGGLVDTGGGALTADAAGSIGFVNGATTSSGAVTMVGADIDFQGPIDSGGGDVALTSTAGSIFTRAITTGSGSLTADSADVLNVGNTVDTGGGDVAATSVNGMIFSASVDTGGGALTADAGGSIDFVDTVTTSTGAVTVTGSDVTFVGMLDSGGGDVAVTSTVGDINFALVDTASGSLTATSAVDLFAGGAIDTAGGAIDFDAGNNVVVSGTMDSGAGAIDLNAASQLQAQNAMMSSNASVTLTGGTVTFSGAGEVQTQGGNLSVTSTTAAVTLLAVDTGSGSVNVNAADAINLNGMMDSGGGTIDLIAGSDMDFNLGVDSGGGDITATAANNVNAFSLVDSGGGAIDLNAVGDITILAVGSIDSGGGAVALTSDTDSNGSGLINIDGAVDTAGGDVVARGDAFDNDSAGGAIDTGTGSTNGVGGAIDIAMNNGITVGNLSSGAAGVDGGTISVVSSNVLAVPGALVVNGTVSSQDGTGGGLTIGAGTTLNPGSMVTVGAGDVVLDGGGLDLFINSAQNFDADTMLIARRDVVIGNAVTTTAGSDLTIEADTDGLINTNGLGAAFGGVEVSGLGSIDSGGFLVMKGSELLNVGGAPNSVILAALGNTADAAGNILILGKPTAPAGSNIELAGAVTSSGGAITVLSQNGVAQDANISTSGGTIDVEALNGDVTMGGTATTASNGGNIRYGASSNVTLMAVNAGTGSVSVNAGNSILDGNLGAVNVTAAEARLVAGDTVGETGGNFVLETDVDTVAASAGAGGIGLSDVDGVTVGTVAAVSVNRVQMDGTGTVAVTDTALSGHTTTNAGHIVQIAAGGGNLTASDTVTADASGNVLLSAGGEIVLSNEVTAGSGSIHVSGNLGVEQMVAGDIRTGGGGTIFVDSSAGGIAMTDGAIASSGGGDVFYSAAAGDVTVGQLDAGSGRVAIVSLFGSILDGGDVGGADIIAAESSLTAASGIGDSGNKLDTQLDTIEARSNPGFYVENNRSITVGPLGGVPTANLVGADGALAGPVTKSPLGDISASFGDAVLVANGDVVIVGGVNAGNDILLQTMGNGNVNLNALVQSGSGNISLLAVDDVNLFAGGSVATAGGSIDIDAGGAVTMANGTTASSGNGNILIVGGTDVLLSSADAGTGSVQIRAGDSIIDNGDANTDVVGAAASFVAGNGVGRPGGTINLLDIEVADMAAQSGAGGIYLQDGSGGVDVETVASFNVNRVGMDGATTAESSLAVTGLVSGAGGSIVAQTATGALNVNAAVSAGGSGNVLIHTVTGGDVNVNTTVDSGSGDISVLAVDNITQAAGGDIATGGGTIEVEASMGGTGAITMSDGATATSGGGNIDYRAANDVTLGGINAGSGMVAVTSTAGSILDGGNTDIDIVGSAAALSAAVEVGDVSAMDSIETGVDTIAATAADGISLDDTNAVSVGAVASFNVNRVRVDGGVNSSLTSALAGHTTTAAGSIVQKTIDGDLTVDSPVDAGATGNILLQTQTGGDISLNANVQSGGGNITLLAADGVNQNVGGNSTTIAGGTIDVEAQNGSITMADTTAATTAGGNVRYAATSDVTVGSLNAGAGNVSIVAGGTILDGGDAARDVMASSTRLDAAGTIGSTSNKLDTQVSTLAAVAGTGMYLDNLGAVAVDDVAAISVNRVGMNGGIASTPTDAAMSDLTTTTDGNIVLTANDTITINDGTATADGLGVNANGAGNVLLMTMGGGDVTLNAGVQSGSGSISLLGADNVTLAGADADVTTGGGTIDIESGAGVLTLDPDVSLTSGGGNINLIANNGDLTITGIDAGAGTVTVTSVTGSILDGGDSVADITASAAGLSAADAVGDLPTMNSIDTAVDTVAATAGAGGISLSDADTVTIGAVSGSGVNRVLMDGTTTSLTASVSATGLVTSAGGSIVARAGGDLTVDEAVDADGAGNVLLEAANNAILNAAVASDTGSIAVTGPDSVQQNAGGDLQTGGAGTMYVTSASGGITMADGATSTTDGGAILYSSDGDITLGSLNAGSGDVGVFANNGTVIDGGDADVDVVAVDVRLEGAGTIGSTTNKIDLSVDNLSAFANSGIYLDNDQGVTVTDTYDGAGVNDVLADGTVSPLAAAAGGSDLVTTTGNIVLTADGFIQLNDGTVTADGNAVNAGGSGNVLLMTAAGSGMTANADVRSGSGNLTLDSGSALLTASGADLVTGGAGTIDVRAVDEVEIADGSLVMANTGNIRLESTNGDVSLGGITTAGDVAVLAGGSILDNGDLQTDVVAGNLLLNAGGTVGSTTDKIDTEVAVITGTAGDGMFVEELAAGGNLEVGSVAFSGVEQVAMDGASSNGGAESGAGLTTTNNGAVVVSAAAGALTINEAVAANGTGNVLLMTAGGNPMNVNADVTSDTGSLHLNGASDVNQDAALGTGGAGTILVNGANLNMTDAASATTAGGDISYDSSSFARLGSLNAGTGSVSVTAVLGINDAGETATDIIASEAYLEVTGGDIGSTSDKLDLQVSTLAASASGDMYLQNTGAVAIDTVTSIDVNTVGMDGTAGAVSTGPFSDLAGGNIVLSSSGTITVNDGVDGDLIGVDAAGTGNVLLMTSDGDIALNAIVRSPDGNISVLADDNVTQAAGGDILITTAGDIDVEAANGSITMTDGAVASTSGGTILYSADGDVTLGGLTSAMNDVRVQSGTGSILDGGDMDTDVAAVNALLTAGGTIGSTTDKIDTELTTVAAQAGDGIFLEELAAGGDLTVGAVNFAGANQVDMGGNAALTGAAADTGLETTGNGAIVASVASGALTVDEAVAAGGAGNVLLVQRGAGDLTLNATVSSGTGSIELSSDGEMVQNGDVSTGGAGTIRATTGNAITMANGASSTTAGGGILYGGDAQVTLGSLNAGSGTVVVYTSGDIVDGGETETDVVGGAAYLEADGGTIGQSADRLETDVSTLAGLATGTGDIFLQNTAAVAVDTVASVNVNRIGMDGAATATATGDASDLTGNDIVLLAGDTITINDGIDGDMVGVDASGAGNVLLRTVTLGFSDVDLNAAVRSGSGTISVEATGNVRQLTAAGDITTGGGTIDVQATGGSIAMDSGAAASSGGGNIRYAANTDASLGLLDAGTGDISVVAISGAIRDAGDAAAMNLIGNEARLEAATGIGDIASWEYLETTLDTVAAETGTGGIALMETDALTIGTVGPITVQRVDMAGGATTPVTDAAMSGYTASAGNVETITQGGDLTVDDVIASGAGKVYLSAEGAGADLTLNTDVTSMGGNVILRSADHLTLNDDVSALMDVALWADTDFNNVGDINQTMGVVEARQGDMFVAGVNLTQAAADAVLRAPQGTIVMTVTNDIRLSSTTTTAPGFGLEARNIVMEANNIFVNTTVSADDVVVMNARAGDILHETPGRILGGTIGLVATGDIGQNGNPIQVASSTPGQLFFLGTFADNSEFVNATGNTSSGLLIPANFYPDNGPEWAEAIPRPFSDPLRPDQDVLEDFLNEKIEAEVVLQIVVNGDLIGGDLLAGQNAQVVVTGNVDLNRIKVTGNLDGTIAGNFVVDNLMVGSLDLSVGGFGIVDEFMVDNFANADFGGDLSGNNMTIGGPLDLNVGGNMTYGTVTLGSATDAITIGGSANIGSLSEAGSLNLSVGGSYAGGSLGVANTLNANIGNNVDLSTLDVGTLNMTAGGNGTIDSFNVAQNANATFGGNLTGGSMGIGGTTDLKVGGNWDYDTVSFGGDANVMVDGDANVNNLDASQNLIAMIGGNATVVDMLVGGNLDGMIGSDFSGNNLGVNGNTLLDVGNNWNYETAMFGGDAEVIVGGDATVTDLMASQNLLAMVGNNFMGSTFDVGNDATLEVGNDWMYDTVNVGGTLDAIVGGQTKATDFTANTMILNAGSAQINNLTTAGDSTAVIGGDMDLDTADIGGDADWTTGGNLDVVQLQVNGSLLASIDNALTFEELTAGSVEIGAGSINLGRLTTGGASISAGGAINNNGAFINASTLSMTAGGNIGGNSPISMNVGTIQTVSGGGNVAITQLKAGDTPIGLLRAGGTLIVDVPNGGLIDNNGPDLNIASGGNSEFNAQYLGTVADALEVEIGGSLLVDGAGLTGEDTANQARVFVNVVGDIVGDARRIQYVGDVAIPGLIFLNGQLLLGDQFLLLEVARTEAFVVETPEIKSPQGVFGDPYFIHLYMQISEAWNLFLDFILFGEAQVNADPEMPPDAKRTIKIGGTEKPYAR